jgi:hypothetical protein
MCSKKKDTEEVGGEREERGQEEEGEGEGELIGRKHSRACVVIDKKI